MCKSVIIREFLFSLKEFFGNDIKRLTVAKYSQDLIPGVRLKEGADLPLDPDRILRAGRADNDQAVSLLQSFGDGLRKIARDRKLVLISEYPRDLLTLKLLLEFVRNMEMLEFPLNMCGNSRI